MRYDALLTVRFVPYPTAGAPRRAVKRDTMALLPPRFEDPNQRTPESANQVRQVRRLGDRPCSHSNTRRGQATGSDGWRNASKAQAVYNRRMIMTISAFRISRSE
jgi:hypothetical protein